MARTERQLVEKSSTLAQETEAMAQANAQSTQLAAELEDTSRQLKNSEGSECASGVCCTVGTSGCCPLYCPV